MELNSIKVGMKVRFGRPNGEKTEGVVEKINIARVKVRQTEERGSKPVGTIWNVPPALLYTADGSTAPVARPTVVSACDPTVRKIADYYIAASVERDRYIAGMNDATATTEAYDDTARRFFNLAGSGMVSPEEVAAGIRLARSERAATKAA